MGYMVHHGIVVTSWCDESIEKAHEKAKEIFDERLVSSVCGSMVNGYASFFIAPDGSKAGWPESHEGDAKRDTFIGWMKSQAYEDGSSSLDWAEVQYGDESGYQYVTRSNPKDAQVTRADDMREADVEAVEQ